MWNGLKEEDKYDVFSCKYYYFNLNVGCCQKYGKCIMERCIKYKMKNKII